MGQLLQSFIKVDSAPAAKVQEIMRNIATTTPSATVILARSAVTTDQPELIRGKRVLVIEDGPTLTHGEMGYGSGVIAAQRYGAAEIVDPRFPAQGNLVETVRQYPWIAHALPAMGYSAAQLHDLSATINATACDTILIATPVDPPRLITLPRPYVRVQYDLEEISVPGLETIVDNFLRQHTV